MIDELKFSVSLLLSGDPDDTLRERIEASLTQIGAKEVNRFRGVYGNTEINQLLVSIDGKELLLQEEAYVGMTAFADKETLAKFRKLLFSY